MAQFSSLSFATYDNTGTAVSGDDSNGVLDDGDVDTTFEAGDTFFGGTLSYSGFITIDGEQMPVLTDGTNLLVFSSRDLANVNYPGSINLGDINASAFTVCFGEGTLIDTPNGEVRVEDLKIGDLILSAAGEAVEVKWVGRQTVTQALAGKDCDPVLISKGALGNNLPHTDLTVTAGHGMVIDGLVINAGALVNGDTINFVPISSLPSKVTYYHIETENHEVILANGAPSETFVDAVQRMVFDNYQEYLDLYGFDRIIGEMDRPRITSRRLVPEEIRNRLGMGSEELISLTA